MKRGPKAPPTTTKLPALRGKTPAHKAEEFFRRYLIHVKGEWAGQPFRLMPWQRQDIIRPLFNTLRPDGRRQYRSCYVEVPRKNAKSTLAAGIALYLLYADHEPGAEIVSAAADREQAAIVFDVARSMVEESPVLRSLATIYRREIVIPSTKSRYRVISSEAYSKHGMNLHAAVIDELHAHESDELLNVLLTSFGSRRQPLSFIITTAGVRGHSICQQYHDRAEQVRDGVITDPTFLPVLYGATVDDDWRDEGVWAQANPGLDVTIKRDYLRQECQRAHEMPSYENEFRRLHLNVWTASETRWLPLELWDKGADLPEPARLRGRRCFAGLDLSTTTDLSTLALVFPDDQGAYDVLMWFWCPEEGLRLRSRRDRVPYAVWAASGLLTVTGGAGVDYDRIRETIRDLSMQYQIARISYDPWNATQLATQLESDGAMTVAVRQGYASLSAPSKEFERLVLAGQLRHGGHPVLRWCLDNTMIERDPAGNIKPSKAKSRERIDGIVAVILALDGATRDVGSIYDTRGLIVL